ncbi:MULTISPECIES: ABC transporter ATP-binding protein [Pseudomonas]|uniref:ABC transporter ATP-binding protein n=1 Tax=Pseudomonas luteola TaxID=47886 RepID=A0A2X2DXY9_PSELU|nr:MULTISPECIES: ABC transporter ATP-binding protein [Pseudomonas]MBF8642740.1 ABC transporter ATP-binding protein [Pseudomonas zeshuii]RRW44594.1 ABC transporter ATP-binding protein [Pseudomonas luteola]SHJ38097.1 simple sugar transport system ATP-binding protein [Pseudomonas zeshuii]SPZ16855.1 ABC transporter ATP-binding protein [Pseudomonas luteola]
MLESSDWLRLELHGITKRYPGCLANDRIALQIKPGEIHALLGENGAGKSTLMKIIYGLTQPDGGEIRWEGEPVIMRDPAQARQRGVGMVFQHFSLFETLTVAENIALALGRSAGTPGQLEPKIREVSQRYGMPLEPQRLVHSLSIGERQRVEIIRCLMQDIKLLILDEPTSVLTPQEADDLFVTLHRLASDGCSILFISHKLGEVRALCQRATVLRGGRVSGHCVPAECSDLELARLMVGEAEGLEAEYPKVEGKTPFLQVSALSWHNADPFGMSLKDVSFQVRSGEIMGIAGVAGNGQDELLALLSGEQRLSAKDSHCVCFGESPIAHLRPDARRRLGMAFVPAERLGHGAVPDMSLTDNGLLTAFQQEGLIGNGLIRHGKVQAFAQRVIERFAVKTPNTETAARSLSGGNLQKFILGREILQQPRLLIAAHPTWGVDVGAAAAIHRALIELRDAGAAILVISEDLEELFQISDRIAALSHGRLSPPVATVRCTPGDVGRWMAGQFDAPTSAAA